LFKDFPEKLKITGNVLNLIKKLVDEEKEHSTLFGVATNFFSFLENSEEESIALAECLTLMRILHILGYMKSDPELTISISSSEITTKALRIISLRRSQIVRLINESLKVV